MNQKVQNSIDDTDRLDEEIDESEDYDDKIGQHVDLINRLDMYKRTPTRFSSPRLATGSAITNVKLSKLEVSTFYGDYRDWTFFFRPIQWSSDRQQPDNRQSKVAVSKNISEKRSHKSCSI